MNYALAEGLTKNFGIYSLFKNITFHVNEGDKIALIARNGVGKSTLLKILAGQETADKGKVWVHKDVTVALFEQNPQFQETKTVLENIFNGQHPIIKAIREYEAAMDSEDSDAITKAVEMIDELNAWDYEAKVTQILTRLNVHHLQNPVSTLSGGQRKRVALAKTLIDIGFEHQHTLLMMDEPTNHLDVEMIEWLENYLNQENVTLLLVTHDRYFLDSVCDEIWELEKENMYVYKGDYENYIEKKAQRIESELSSIQKAKNEYRKELEWMRKQPKARTTKSKSRQENFYEVEEKAKQKIEDIQLELEMKMSRLGNKIVEMKKVSKNYGDLSILKDFEYSFRKGEKLGIVGKNGVGKTTFLSILQKLEQPDSGEVQVGDTIVFGNFSQQGLVFKQDMRVIEYVKTIAESFPLANGGKMTAAQFLELFLFPPEKQYTYLSALSGGEKKRLQLLVVLFRNPNFLILDEPTNDLDLPTLAVLEKFLDEYQGCVLIVSHDRYFMDRLVDHLLIFEGKGNVRDFPGNYTQYRLWIKENEKKGSETQKIETEIKAEYKVSTENNTKKKMSFKEKQEFEKLEKEIPLLEEEKRILAEKMTASLPFAEVQKLSEKMKNIIQLLEQKEARWLELSEMN